MLSSTDPVWMDTNAVQLIGLVGASRCGWFYGQHVPAQPNTTLAGLFDKSVESCGIARGYSSCRNRHSSAAPTPTQVDSESSYTVASMTRIVEVV